MRQPTADSDEKSLWSVSQLLWWILNMEAHSTVILSKIDWFSSVLPYVVFILSFCILPLMLSFWLSSEPITIQFRCLFYAFVVALVSEWGYINKLALPFTSSHRSLHSPLPLCFHLSYLFPYRLYPDISLGLPASLSAVVSPWMMRPWWGGERQRADHHSASLIAEVTRMTRCIRWGFLETISGILPLMAGRNCWRVHQRWRNACKMAKLNGRLHRVESDTCHDLCCQRNRKYIWLYMI